MGGAGGRVVMSETTKQRNGTHTQRTGNKKKCDECLSTLGHPFVESTAEIQAFFRWYQLCPICSSLFTLFLLTIIYLNCYIIWDQSAIRQINFNLFLSDTIYVSPYVSFASIDGVWVGLCHACFHDKASRLGQTDRHTYNTPININHGSCELCSIVWNSVTLVVKCDAISLIIMM